MWGIAAALFFAAGLLTPKQVSPHVESARIGNDQRVYLRWTGQPERVQRRGEEESDTSDLRVAPDRMAAAWLVGRTDISDASYPETFELLVAWAGKSPRSIFPGHVVSEWRFQSGGRQIALYDNTAHGDAAGCAMLFDAANGRLLARWRPGSKTALPGWAAPFHAEWDSYVR